MAPGRSGPTSYACTRTVVLTANAPRTTSVLCSDTTSSTVVSTSCGRSCSQLGSYDADQRMVTLQHQEAVRTAAMAARVGIVGRKIKAHDYPWIVSDLGKLDRASFVVTVSGAKAPRNRGG